MAGEAWQFAGSLVAVAVMVALAWRFGFAGAPVLADGEEAREVAQGLPGGFAPRSLVLDRAGHGALLTDDRGRIAAIVPHGAHFLARLVEPGAAATADGEDLVLSSPGLAARFTLGEREASHWAAAINQLV